MSNLNILITVASWEDRFRLNLINILEGHSFGRVLMFYFKEFSEMSKENRDTVFDRYPEKIVPVELSYGNYIHSWKIIRSCFELNFTKRDQFTLDISTCPRDLIWTFLLFAKHNFLDVSYCYAKPVGYSLDWLSRYPANPRLVLKLSGIYSFEKPTLLLIASGFDTERAEQLIRHYEPKKILLGLQVGDQFDNKNRNRDEHIKSLSVASPPYELQMFDLDAYSDEHGIFSIEDSLGPYINDYNVVACSNGPKLSAISLFRLHVKHPCIGLSYTPSKDYNIEYSHGIGEVTWGRIQFS
ncbi:MAG: hypothetical protein AAGU21_06530 [Solidesulfovibrio sp.]|uniref:hypothetical protein n=1 Tax=Solidesulfovibrio sp. TaxID=2910990 RepID=UPI0031594990